LATMTKEARGGSPRSVDTGCYAACGTV
jgi:hypothetical protein